MKWAAYVGWFFAWFIIHSFIFTPAMKASTDAVSSGIIGAVNGALLIGGFIVVSRKFKKS